MPTMYEIYQRHSKEYDQLVEAEDYQGNLGRTLHRLVKWDGAIVVEAGTGTGRVTELYAQNAKVARCFDREQHMLEAAKLRLGDLSDKVTFQIGDNLQLPDVGVQADVSIEGWSWGHTILDGNKSIEETTSALMMSASRSLRANGILVVIETMGTNVEQPSPPNEGLSEFYGLLESKYGMHQEVIRTDYKFDTVDEAAKIVGFFFGEGMTSAILERNRRIVPEWTGIWKGTLELWKNGYMRKQS